MALEYACTRFAEQCLQLETRDPIGMGNRRRVFQHPDHPDLCIKVARQEHIRQSLDKRGGLYKYMPTRWRDDNWLEAIAYQQAALQDAASPNWAHIPRLHGWQDTDIGTGLVFDYYRTETGEAAPNLAHVLADGIIEPHVQTAIDGLIAYLSQTDVWMRHPGPPNIVLAADGKLKLIDCLGTYNMRVFRPFKSILKRRRGRHIAYLQRAVDNALKTAH